jgi:hypothetical protein
MSQMTLHTPSHTVNQLIDHPPKSQHDCFPPQQEMRSVCLSGRRQDNTQGREKKSVTCLVIPASPFSDHGMKLKLELDPSTIDVLIQS